MRGPFGYWGLKKVIVVVSVREFRRRWEASCWLWVNVRLCFTFFAAEYPSYEDGRSHSAPLCRMLPA